MAKRPSYEELELRYGALFENNHAILLVIDFKTAAIVDANPAACTFYGYPKQTLTAMSIFDINTLSRQEIFAEMKRARTQRRNYFCFQHRLADGSVRDVEVYSGPVNIQGRALLYSIIHDITKRKQAEDRLAENEHLLSSVFDSIQDGMSLLDTDLTIRRVNDVMKKWYAANLPLEGKKCHACYHGRSRPCDPCPTLRCIESGTTEREVIPGPQGSAVQWIEVFSFPMKDPTSRRVIGVVEFVRDISEQKQAEAQLQQAQKMEAIGTLAGGIAHDFNNLLMGIQGRTSLIQSEIDPTHPFYEHLEQIENCVRGAADLTKQLLGFARAGKYEIKPTDLNEVVAETVRMFGRTKKEISIYKKYADDLWTVEVDRSQIGQVLLNIFVNAWQAMPRGGDLYIQTENVTLSEKDTHLDEVKSGRYVKVSITDSGIGMPKDSLEKIFDPFFTTKEKGRGTGLGLASAYGIIRNHNGWITAESQKGHGSTFTILLPATDRVVPTQPTIINHIQPGSETVLLVDDEQMILGVGCGMLEKMGYTVMTAGSGIEAVEIYSTEKERIDMVILDMIMPDLSGAETFDRLKQLNPEIKVLLSSGYSLDGKAADILNRGCRGFIQKPFGMRQLSEKIRAVIDDR